MATGPPPKRSDRRRRRNKPKPGEEITKGQGAAVVEVPEAGDWVDFVVRWYESLGASGQSAWYEPSDWAVAWLIAENMDRDLQPRLVINQITGAEHEVEGSISGTKMAGYLKAMTALLMTEADRRRSRMELERPKPVTGDPKGGGAAGVTWIDEARRRQGSG